MATKMPCGYCKKKIDINATRCPYCQAQFTPEEVAARKKDASKIAFGCLAVIVLIALVSMCSGTDDKAPSGSTASTTAAQQTLGQPVAQVASNDASPSNTLTSAQANAARKAQSYLDMTGFSRKGLIEQLSSDAGDGFDRADAAAAVDSLNVDWNEQAVRSAKSYLDMTGFSCKGLIEQLSSTAGADYTREQAEYGAKQAGACG